MRVSDAVPAQHSGVYSNKSADVSVASTVTLLTKVVFIGGVNIMLCLKQYEPLVKFPY
jgi:cell division protein ZapA (FtsZ GTPase activity inhibitor)